MADSKLLDMLKLSLRVDDDSPDDELLKAYLNGATRTVIQAVGDPKGVMADFYAREDVVNSFNIAVISLASAYYTHRSALSDTGVRDVTLPYKSIVGQLRALYCYLEQQRGGDEDGQHPSET